MVLFEALGSHRHTDLVAQCKEILSYDVAMNDILALTRQVGFDCNLSHDPPFKPCISFSAGLLAFLQD